MKTMSDSSILESVSASNHIPTNVAIEELISKINNHCAYSKESRALNPESKISVITETTGSRLWLLTICYSHDFLFFSQVFH